MLALVIYIQSDVIEGTLVNFPALKDGTKVTSQTLYSTVVRIPRKTHTTGDYVTKMMLKGIEDLCAHIVKEVPKVSKEPIKSIHYILSTPWVISQSKTVEIKYEKDTLVTENIVREIINEDRKKLVETYENDMIFVEQKIFQVELNGYPVQNYHNKKTRTLKISFAFTLSSDKIIKKIEAAVSKNLYIAKEHYHSAILLQYMSSRELVSEAQDLIVLHVHGELTDVVVVKKGFSSYLASFPFGTSTLVRKVATSLKSTFEETTSSLAMLGDKKLDETHHNKMETVLASIMKGWQSDCMQSIEGIGKQVAIPRLLHLYAETPLEPLFKKALQEHFDVVVHKGTLREIHVAGLESVV